MTTQALLSPGSIAEWRTGAHRRFIAGALLLVSLFASFAMAGPREQALEIHNRVAGVPPSESVLLQMADLIADNNVAAAVDLAMANEAFYSVTLKNMATPWTNRDQTVFEPLNDYTATFIGMVRDDRALNGILSDNITYVGSSNLSGVPAYSNNSNAHYEELEARGYALGDTNVLVSVAQSSLNNLPAEATAGVMTSRAAAKAFFILGTNRAMLRFTLMNHLCRDLEQLHDTSLVPDRIRQDVSRSPGGDSRVFLNSCIGCHNGMDPLAQAFAYYDYAHDVDAENGAASGNIHYNVLGAIDPDTNSRVVKKYHINASTFRPGYVTPDDQWTNYWREGQNASLEWGPGSGSGAGAKSLGIELASTRAFAQCHVERVFRHVCLRQPADAAERSAVSEMTNSFISSGYRLKQAFRETADYCLTN